jgi:hypothetical protein
VTRSGYVVDTLFRAIKQQLVGQDCESRNPSRPVKGD